MRTLKISTCFILTVILIVLGAAPVLAQYENGYQVANPDFSLPVLEKRLSADGLSATNAAPVLMLVADPNPEMQGARSPGRTADQALAAPDAAMSTVSITYVAAGQQDPWGQVCAAFPDGAKTAFQAAAAIWQNKVRSSVPITIRACWANLGSSSILGYSGGQPIHRNFNGAPKSNTWYQQSLANALAGTRLGNDFDMHITYNSMFPWYLGTDGNTPYGKYDLVTVAAHEIGHGLNFAGSAQYLGGIGSYGYGGYPDVYDTFVQSGAGTPLTTYTTPSSALGSLLTSNNLWFSGPNANAANGGSRVKIYAPSSWSDGSSFSHLDYATYAGTANRMMVYAVSSASSSHDPGPVALGLLKDLGWSLDSGFSMSGMVRQGSSTGAALAGATVAIAGQTTTTSSTGTFSITGIPAGSYTLTISKSGFSTKTTTGYTVSGNQSALNFFLSPVQSFSLSGTVRSGSATGPVVAGATVSIAGKSAVTSSTGTFSITGVPGGTYSMVISKAGYYTKTMTGMVISANRTAMALYLTPAPIYSLSGTVRSGGTTGPVLPGATISIAGKTVVSSSTGTFLITGVLYGTYSMVISKSGYYTKTMTGMVINASRTGMVLYLSPIPAYTMSGVVRHGSTTGAALAGATVSIAGKTATTSSTGTFSISGIRAGTQTLTISKSGYLTRTITGTVSANMSGLVYYLTPIYTMSGTVRSGSATGPVLAGATVSIAGKTATTSSTGTFSIAAIPAGSYTLSISKSGYTTKVITGYSVTSNQSSLVFFLAPASSYGTVRVINGSGSLAVAQLYISPSTSTSWGPNQLPVALPPGYAVNVGQVPPNTYDLLAVFSNGSTYVKWSFPVVAGMTTTITALPGGSGAVDLLKPAEAGEAGGLQVPLQQGAGGAPKR